MPVIVGQICFHPTLETLGASAICPLTFFWPVFTMIPSYLIAGCGSIGQLIAEALLLPKQRPAQGQTPADIMPMTRNAELVPWATQHGLALQCIDFDQLPIPTIGSEPMWPAADRVIYLAPPSRSSDNDHRIAAFLAQLALQPPQRLVYISTSGVYGDHQGEWVTEASATNAQEARSKRRLSAELQCQQFAQQHNIQLVILRVPGIYGAKRLPQRRIASGEPIVRRADSPWSNRIFDQDLVQLCVAALQHEQASGIYNVADLAPSTMYDYFKQVAAHLGLPCPPTITLDEAQGQLSIGMLSYMRESRRVDGRKILQELGVTLAAPSLADGLALLRQAAN